MLASVVCFTTNVLIVRQLGDKHVSLWLISCGRFIIGLGLIASIYRQEVQPKHLFTRGKLVERGIAGALGVYFTYLAVLHIGPGRATFINNTYVIWGALLATWVLKEKLRLPAILGSVAALTGLALLTHLFTTGARPGFYDGVAVVATLISAYVVVTIRQLHRTEHTATIFAAQCVYGLLICGVPALQQDLHLPASAWGLLLLASTLAGAGQIMMTRAFRELTVLEGSLLQMLVPVGIALGSAIIFHEHFSPFELFGAAMILAGTLFAAVRPAPAAVAK